MDYFKKMFKKDDKKTIRIKQTKSVERTERVANKEPKPTEDNKFNVFQKRKTKRKSRTPNKEAKPTNIDGIHLPPTIKETKQDTSFPDYQRNRTTQDRLQEPRVTFKDDVLDNSNFNNVEEPDSMKRVINKMSVEESTIASEIEGLEKRNFPSPYPNQPSFPDSYPNSLTMKPISNEMLHNFSKQKLDTKKQQKEMFVNYKQETDFYRRFIPMNEVKKQRLQQEINELKQRSMMQSMNGGDDSQQIEAERQEVERLKQMVSSKYINQNSVNQSYTYGNQYNNYSQPQQQQHHAPQQNQSFNYSQQNQSYNYSQQQRQHNVQQNPSYNYSQQQQQPIKQQNQLINYSQPQQQPISLPKGEHYVVTGHRKPMDESDYNPYKSNDYIRNMEHNMSGMMGNNISNNLIGGNDQRESANYGQSFNMRNNESNRDIRQGGDNPPFEINRQFNPNSQFKLNQMQQPNRSFNYSNQNQSIHQNNQRFVKQSNRNINQHQDMGSNPLLKMI